MHPEAVASLPIYAGGLLLTALAILGAVCVELLARRFLPRSFRSDHASSASAIFTVIGTTYAVLLAFVTMLSWDGFIGAQAATDAEASHLRNIYVLVDGLSGPEMPAMRADILAYANRVIGTEWQAQSRGISIDEASPPLERLMRTALQLRPTNIADGNLHALLLSDLSQLATARRLRLAAARTTLPGVVWFVLVAGGAITVAFASFLYAPSFRMHLVMSSLLAVSGALVMVVILSLSNPFRGDLRISPDPFQRVLVQMAPK